MLLFKIRNNSSKGYQGKSNGAQNISPFLFVLNISNSLHLTRKSDNVEGQISEKFFKSNGGYCAYYSSNIYCKRQRKNWCTLSIFSWSIFSHVTCSDKSRVNEIIQQPTKQLLLSKYDFISDLQLRSPGSHKLFCSVTEKTAVRKLQTANLKNRKINN